MLNAFVDAEEFDDEPAYSAEQLALSERFDRGEEIDLLEAVTVFRIRPDECWKLAAYCARGKYRGISEEYSPITADVWEFVRWETNGAAMWLVSPEGDRTYSVWLSAPTSRCYDKSLGHSELNCSQTDMPAAAPIAEAMAITNTVLEDLAELFSRVASTVAGSGEPWTIADYEHEVSKVGLSLSATAAPRVLGVTIASGGKVERSKSSTSLRNILLVSRFPIDQRAGEFDGYSQQGIARALHRWLVVNHPLVDASLTKDPHRESLIDGTVSLLRNNFRATLPGWKS